MKKFLISALAVVATLFVTNSCVREPDYITDPAQAVTVTYSVSLDQVQKSKATLAELDNAVAVNKLFYSVYVQSGTGTSATYTPVNHSDYHKVVALDANGTADVTIKLIENDSYKVVFWAQKDNAYLTAPSDGQLALTGVLENIAIDYSASDSFAEDKDAFTAYDILEISPVTTNSENGKSFQKEIHLKRPFAQINFGADDGAQATALGYAPYKVKVSVKQAATTFNAATGVAAGAQDVEFKQVELPTAAVNFTVNSKDYQRVGKAYVLPVGTFTVDQTTQAITDALSANVEITLDLQLQKADQTTVDLDSRAKANVPVRSNYRTNLLGSLITTDVTFNVVVDNDYDGSTDYISIVTAGNASGSGAVTLSQPETIGSNINFGEHAVTLDETLTIGANVTISGGSSITVNKSIVVQSGKTLTLDNVTINPSSTEATITIEPGASLIINGGTYTADNNQVLFDLLNGSGPSPAPKPNGILRVHGADGDQLIIRGGSFVGFDPSNYVDLDHYTVTESPAGTWAVAEKQVTLTVEAGDVNMKVGDEAVLKTLTVDPADTDLSGIAFEYSVANVAAASYSEGKISIAAVGAGSTVITVKVGAASATINVTVLPADSIEVAPASLSLKVGQTSEAVTVTLNNNATVSSVASNNANATVNWTSGNTFTVTGAAIGESTITVTASNGKTATVAVTVSKADAVKLAAPVLSTENAVADATSIMLSWAAVEHASGYAVSYGAESPVNVSTNEVTLSNLALATEYTISVVAKGDGDAYTDSDASNSIQVATQKGTVTIVVAENKDVISIVKGLTATISGVSVKYGETVLDVPVQYTLGSDAEGKISLSGTTITALDVTDGAGINIVFAGNATYYAKTETDAIMVEVTTPVLTGITLNTTAVKKEFTIGVDQFTSSNLEVTASYNNNTSKPVTPTSVTPENGALESAGTKTVTVSYTEGEVTKTATYEITVKEPDTPAKTDQSITLTIGGNSIIGTTVNKAYGDAAFTVTAEAPSNNVVLTSGNTAVATVSGTTITIVGIGSAVITANAEETEEYNAASPVSFTVTVAKADLAAPTVTATAGDDKKITVTWDTVTGAASYTVKIGETETANATSPFVTAALENGTYAVSVKAIGDANHNDSAYSTAQNVEIADAQVTYTTIAQLKGNISSTNSSEADAFDVNVQNVVVTYVNGKNAFLQDASGAILLYMDSHGLTAGKTITGHITGTGCIYQGLYEIVTLDMTGATISDGTVPEPATVTIAQLNENLALYESQRLKVVGASVLAAVSGKSKSGTLVQGSDEIALFTKDNVVIPANKTFDIIVYPAYHNTDKQVNIWATSDISNIQSVLVNTTLSVADIEVKEGQDKSIVPTVNPSNAVITYALKNASDSEFVTVDNNTAKVHGVKKTTTPVVVVATVAAVDGEYTAASVEFNVTVVEDNGTGSEVIDTITSALLTATSTTYTDFSNVSATSDARYAGNSAKSSSGGIQMRSKNSNSGIVSTVSGGTVKSVKITVESGSNTIDVYGSNTAYTGAADLYATGNNDNQGTKIGSLTETGTIEFKDEYKYVGIRSNNGAIYVTSVEITWNN